jgi:hypothetical protein
MVMADLGIDPGLDFLNEDSQDCIEKLRLKGGRLETFSLTATRAIYNVLRFHRARRGKVTLRIRLRAKESHKGADVRIRVYEYYDPDVCSVARPVQWEVGKR